ncbi:MarP family serine protease [soil metagenome]
MTPSLILDIVLVIGLVLYTIHGFRNGFALSIGGLLGFAAGAVAAFFAIPLVASWVPSTGWRVPAVLLAVLGLTALGQVLGSAIGRVIRGSLGKTPLRSLDRALGAVVNFVVAAIVISMLAFGLNSLGVPFLSTLIASSKVISTVDAVTPAPVRALEAQVRSLVAQDGLPRLFTAINPDTTVAVPAQTSGNTAQQDAAKSVVKITGNAYQCGQNQSGSGFVVSGNRVITNAHVVAGVANPVVEAPNGKSGTGKVVYFDPQNDLAVIAVNGLGTVPLTMGTNLPVGATAAFDGYPLGGPFSTAQAAVQQVSTVAVPNIYDADASEREVYYLSATVQEGNSGGPLVSTAGKVVGVIFAKSATSANLGFALTTTELEPVMQAAAGYSATVSSGHCTRG